MRHLLILSCLLFGTGATADEADFDFKSLGAKKALRDYKASGSEGGQRHGLRGNRRRLEAEARGQGSQDKHAIELMRMNLEQALKTGAADAGTLEEANKIDAAIKALKKGASPAGASVANRKAQEDKKNGQLKLAIGPTDSRMRRESGMGNHGKRDGLDVSLA